MKNWMLIFGLMFLSGISFGREWPLPEQTLEEILHRSKRWSKLSVEEKNKSRSRLIYALHLAGSLEAHQIFFQHLGEGWDSSAPEQKKNELIKEAEILALETAKRAVEKWAESKTSSGKLGSADWIISQLTSRNLATERFHEWDRFLNNEGEINYKSWPLGGDSSRPENERVPVDLIRFLSDLYPGNPTQRRETKKKQREDYQRDIANGQWGVPRGSTTGNSGTHCESTSSRPCGTPSSNAATLRPEFNGRQ